MRYVMSIAGCLLAGLSGMSALAAECTDNPQALGTSRVLVVDPAEHARIGSMQYAETLPLAEKEVVLTFDDGPLPVYTNRVLATLAAHCAKATFFIVGSMARAYPETVRKIYNAGHTVGTHTFGHPRFFATVSHDNALAQIDDGIAAVGTALGDTRALAPFFRFPGLGRTPEAEAHLATLGIMTWSVDAHGDDWMKLSTAEVIERLMGRLEAKGKGVLLLHDIQPGTALALPQILAELKTRGYRVVHVVPSGHDRPKTVTEPEAWAFSSKTRSRWPVVAQAAAAPPALPAPSTMSFGFPEPLAETLRIAGANGAPGEIFQRPSVAQLFQTHKQRRTALVWPAPDLVQVPDSASLPAPSAQTFANAALALSPSKTISLAKRQAERRQVAARLARQRMARGDIQDGVAQGMGTPPVAHGTTVETSDQPRPPGRIAMRSPEQPATGRKAPPTDTSAAWSRRLNWFH